MLKKRLIGVITVKDGLAVQSFNYKRYLPLGNPEVIAENLDRWGADEILLQCIDRTACGLGPDFALLERLGKAGLSTPLIYSGGIRSIDDGVLAVKLGADRICLDALLKDSPQQVIGLSRVLGAQALIASFPLSVQNCMLNELDYRYKKSKKFDEFSLTLLKEKVISEALAIDWKNEGVNCGFDFRIIQNFPLKDIPIIAFGGISEANQYREILDHPQVSAIAIGNFLNYKEHSILHIKKQLMDVSIRIPL